MKINFGLAFLVFIILASGIFISVVISSYAHFSANIECFNNIAQNYCEEQGMFFHSSVQYFLDGEAFNCKYNKRSLIYERFQFTEEEIEGCY